MAKIIPSSIVGGVSGAVGGVVFAVQKSGCIVQARGRHRKNLSNGQQAEKISYTIAQARWKMASSDQKRAWRIAAAQRPKTDVFGQRRPYSGYALFIENALYQGGYPIPSTAYPPVNETSGFRVFSISTYLQYVKFQMELVTNPGAGITFHVWYDRPGRVGMAPTKKFIRKYTRFSTISDTTFYQLQTNFAPYQPFESGEIIYFKVRARAYNAWMGPPAEYTLEV